MFFNGERPTLIDVHFSDEFSIDLSCFLSKVSTEDTVNSLLLTDADGNGFLFTSVLDIGLKLRYFYYL